MVEHLTFNQVVRGSSPRWLMQKNPREIPDSFHIRCEYALCVCAMQVYIIYKYAGVAELADAPDLGSGGRPCRFKSCHPQESP